MAATKGGVEIGEQEAKNDVGVTKPKESNLYQQKLPAWQPLMTASYGFLMCLTVGTIFIPVGTVLFLAAHTVQEVSIDYTKCRDSNGLYCAELIAMPGYYGIYRPCMCSLTVNLTQSIPSPVYVYYALTNFYQSHRRYAKSRDDFQLRGHRSSNLLKDCDPYKQDARGLWVAPCGAVANSLFNDSFELFYQQPATSSIIEVPWTNKGIAWQTDRDRRYGIGSNWNVSTKPTNWPVSQQQRSPSGYQSDEELMVWMRTAPLPTFRKLHRIVLHGANGTPEAFTNSLPVGIYTLKVAYAFPVTGFAGTKSLVFTNANWMGGRNPVLGAAFMAVGCLYTVLGLGLALVQLHSNRSTVLSVNYPRADIDLHSRSTSESALADADQLAMQEKADLALEDVNSADTEQQNPQARPRNFLQTLTLADY